MPDGLAPVFAAIAATIGGIVATGLASRRLSRLGLADSQLQVNKTLRELAEAAGAKAELLEERLHAEQEAHATTRAERDRYRQEADDCDRRLAGVYAELRRTGHLEDRRRTPRAEREEGDERG